MNFDHLRYFLEAARAEHVGRASRLLAVSPSAVSHAVAALEEELGVELFARTGRGISLTSEGRRFQAWTADMLARIRGVREEMGGGSVDLPERLRVAATHGALLRAFSGALARAGSARPGLTWEISGLRSVDVLRAVSQGEVECGLCFSPLDHPRVDVRVVATSPLSICLREGHPLLARATGPANGPASERGNGRAFPFASLSAFPYLAATASHGIEDCERHPCLAALGLEPAPKAFYDAWEAMAEGVRASDGWSFVPAIGREAGDGLVYLDLGSARGVPPVADVAVITPRGRGRSRSLESVLEALKEALRG